MKNRITHLYRHFNELGELLYVGVSFCPILRTKNHLETAGWFNEIRTIKIENFNNRREAFKAERLAITTESPRYNQILYKHQNKIYIRKKKTILTNATGDRQIFESIVAAAAWLGVSSWMFYKAKKENTAIKGYHIEIHY